MNLEKVILSVLHATVWKGILEIRYEVIRTAKEFSEIHANIIHHVLNKLVDEGLAVKNFVPLTEEELRERNGIRKPVFALTISGIRKRNELRPKTLPVPGTGTRLFQRAATVAALIL